MSKRLSLALALLSLLLAGCGGTSSITAPTPTGPRPPVPLSVYLATNYPQTDRSSGYDTLYAFNASDGTKRWQHNTGKNFADFTQGVSVLYLAVDGVVHAIDTSNNQELWTYKTGQRFAPLIADGRALLAIPSSDQKQAEILALDANTGATLWHTTVDSDVILGVPSPVAVDGVADGMVFVGGFTGLRTLKETNGVPLWSQTFEGGSPSLYQVSNGLVYVIVAGNQTETVVALNASDGSKRWQFPKSGGVRILYEQIAVANGSVFLVTNDPAGGQVVSLKVGDGSVRWQKPVQRGAVDDWDVDQNGIYLSMQGTIEALAVNDGSQRWQQQLLTTHSSIAVTSDGMGYMRSSDEGLVFFHTSDGSVLWHFPAPSQLSLSVEDIINGVVYVSGIDDSAVTLNTFYALSAADGSVRWMYAVGGNFDVIVG